MNGAHTYIDAGEENTRTFGVEVEFLHPNHTKFQVADILENAGFRVECAGYHDYSHTDNAWKLAHDGSIGGNGSELVSPILSGKAGLRQLVAILDVLNTIPGVGVNMSCGVHVHHGVPEADGNVLRNIINIYRRSEALIDQIMPRSRRGNNNRFCIGHLTEAEIPDHVANRGARAVVDWEYSRYVKVNVQSWVRYGTVEFRHHGGSTDPAKIVPWVILTQTLVEKAIILQHNRSTPFANWDTLKDMLRETGNPMWSQKVSRWVTRRLKDFNAEGVNTRACQWA